MPTGSRRVQIAELRILSSTLSGQTPEFYLSQVLPAPHQGFARGSSTWNMFNLRKYDVVVIGSGHAGIEAAMAAARLSGSPPGTANPEC